MMCDPARLIRYAVVLLTTLIGNVVLAQESQPQRPRRVIAAATLIPEGTRELRDIEYVKGGGRAQSLDLFIPPNADKPMPLIIGFHGGGWRSGDKAQNPGIGLLRAGYVVASVNYRLSQQAIWPAQIHDCKAAVRWLRAHAEEYHIDPDRIGVWGASAGGHLVAMLGTAGDAKELEGDGENANVSSKVQAVCDLFGPSDLTRTEDEAAADGAVPKLLGGPIRENLEKAKQASPLTYVSRDDPPFLILHGTKDPLVPVRQSQWLHDALKKAGVESHLDIIEGAGHGGAEFFTPARRKMILDFLDTHLKRPATQPATKPVE